ncbi:hypothetical protein JCM5296_005109 [Sporobolomyces johnsonii]
MNLPAHETKHLDLLVGYTLPDQTQVNIHQDNSTPDSTGRTVWLGAQILSVYLYHLLHDSRPFSHSRRKTVVDLGSGTGLLSLSLASMGYHVLATDLDFIVDGVLRQNIEANERTLGVNGVGEAKLRTKVLDWFEPPEDRRWDEEGDDFDDSLRPPFDMIVTADTVYDPSLSQPLLRTLQALSMPSLSASPSSPYAPSPPPIRSTSHTPPPIYLALEARDPALVAAFLASASADWDFKCSRIDHPKLKKLVESKEGMLGWEDEEAWEGIELWKLKWKGSRTVKSGDFKKSMKHIPGLDTVKHFVSEKLHHVHHPKSHDTHQGSDDQGHLHDQNAQDQRRMRQADDRAPDSPSMRTDNLQESPMGGV